MTFFGKLLTCFEYYSILVIVYMGCTIFLPTVTQGFEHTPCSFFLRVLIIIWSQAVPLFCYLTLILAIVSTIILITSFCYTLYLFVLINYSFWPCSIVYTYYGHCFCNYSESSLSCCLPLIWQLVTHFIYTLYMHLQLFS